MLSDFISPDITRLQRRLYTLCYLDKGGVDGVMGEMEECGIKRKPAPDMLLRVMDELGATPADTIYSGDSDVDVITAGRAGVECISVTWGFQDEDRLRGAGAKHVAHHPRDIIRIIDSL